MHILVYITRRDSTAIIDSIVMSRLTVNYANFNALHPINQNKNDYPPLSMCRFSVEGERSSRYTLSPSAAAASGTSVGALVDLIDGTEADLIVVGAGDNVGALVDLIVGALVDLIDVGSCDGTAVVVCPMD